MQIFDARTFDRALELWPGSSPGRSSGRQGEELVGVHIDGHKIVSQQAHGLFCAWDARSTRKQLLASAEINVRDRSLRVHPIESMDVCGEWICAVSAKNVHLPLDVRG